ncbi:Telomere repeat-binding protein 5 [Sesamum angolense]|uniref:Telomere repeat-binding protein 5 n=1 Tax=Sesamum angolense TaxID=2727404 RepID=A0AAE1XBD0_9LAMI|nr:Telomere repeat-binding protein 5 [Sesamum angolense]
MFVTTLIPSVDSTNCFSDQFDRLENLASSSCTNFLANNEIGRRHWLFHSTTEGRRSIERVPPAPKLSGTRIPFCYLYGISLCFCLRMAGCGGIGQLPICPVTGVNGYKSWGLRIGVREEDGFLRVFGLSFSYTTKIVDSRRECGILRDFLCHVISGIEMCRFMYCRDFDFSRKDWWFMVTCKENWFLDVFQTSKQALVLYILLFALNQMLPFYSESTIIVVTIMNLAIVLCLCPRRVLDVLMISLGRLEYGFNGYQVPPTPRAARSVRRRCLFKSKAGNRQLCAFDLLATVADKILLDTGRSPPSVNTSPGREQQAIVVSSVEKEEKNEAQPFGEKSFDRDCYERNFLFTELVSEAPNLKICSNELVCAQNDAISTGITTPDCSEKVGSAEQLVDDDCKLRLGISSPTVDVVSSDCRLSTKSGSEDELATRDDDEEYSELNDPSTGNKACRPPSRVGDHGTRKTLASKHLKVTLDLKDDEHYNTNNFKRERSMRDYPFKKRKLYDCGSGSNSDEAIDSQGICVIENGTNEGERDSPPTPPRGEHASFPSGNPQVKLKIKSFRVPELFIEIPETATVGCLKRTVMKAVNAVLGGGICVGVLLQGKKIRDDNKTLLQTGISHDNKMDTLGFTLEPSITQAPIQLCPEDRSRQLVHDNQLRASSFPSDMSLQKTATETKALVPIPATKPDALAVVPLRTLKRSESAQRRIRRPFTVAEVEALVQAVEKLGTGRVLVYCRWRDVKLRAFENAKHRTYVDLKDKWKTLVHTARIAPQQRRGEPVPQELLDRVLTAHAYWSQQQPRQHLKSQPDTCLLL